ncbi:MAG TPA: F0F1 ATP synthase subunit A, partial [Steroidobacteraceae bacterium]
MHITPDQLVLWQYGFVKLNATIVTTWGLMLLLTVGASLITRKLTSDVITSRWQAALEILVTGIDEQIKEVGLKVPEHYVAFIGTLFIFVASANLFTIVPGYEPPTSSLSTTAALAACVFGA